MARGRGGAQSRTPRKPLAGGDVPDVYREMLADAVSSSPTQRSEGGRPIKRRRVGGRVVTESHEEASSHQSDLRSEDADTSDLDDLFEDVEPKRQRLVQTESEDSADSDMDWEEVEIRDDKDTASHDDDDGQLNLTLGDDGDEHENLTRGKVKRKPMTAEDKKLRLEIHKMHLCSLLAHVYLRNHWCNDGEVYTIVRKLLTTKNIAYLNPDEDRSQFQRSRSFMDGLTQVSDAFRGEFKITSRGMGKSRWADSPETLALLQPPDDIDLPMQISDFRDAARKLEASRDVGAQLFCATLRSGGVDARLVCSLQPLPFQPSQKVELHQVKPRASEVVRDKARPSRTFEDTITESSDFGPMTSNNAGQSQVEPGDQSQSPRMIHDASPIVSLPSRKRRKPIRESKYPVYWVEAFNEAVQKWVPVDPLVTKTIAKPSKFEPPLGESENHMSYVIAFEDDGSARDVTRRYVKAYNAKTRRERVEVTSGGDKWWRRVMKMYRRPHRLDRDQVEDAELTSKEAAEPMPRNVQDFKDHPYYALERHLKRHEVIHPKREVGKVGAGRAGNVNVLESIFRRRDVHLVKSADKWYRLGRELKPGEQPLKYVPARKRRGASMDLEDQEAADEDNSGTALYAAHQTTVYSAPPVVNGRIPKNVYGNLDVYVPSMIPPGGAHILHPDTARAAKIVGIDYADAVTGFVFKGRHGTAVTHGAVVAAEYKEAVEEVIRAFEDDRARMEEERRSLEAMRMWKRMLAGLRVMERIEGYYGEGDQDQGAVRDISIREEMSQVDQEIDEEEGGGFVPDRDAEGDVQPTAGNLPAGGFADMIDDAGGGFIAEDPDESSLLQGDIDPPRLRDPFINNIEDDDGGGFLVNDADADAEEALQEMNAMEKQMSLPINETLDPGSRFADGRKESEADDCFLLNDDETTTKLTDKTIHGQIVESTNESTEDLVSDLGEPHLSDDELEEAMVLQRLRETSEMNHSPVMTQDTTKLLASDQSDELSGDLPAESIHTIGALASHSQTSSASPRETAAMSEACGSSEDDKGSLLSHDPDDEDADPEWLA